MFVPGEDRASLARAERFARFAFPSGLRAEHAARIARLSVCPEIDCLRNRLPPGVLAAAEQRALAIGVGADEVLVAAGHIDEAAYCRTFAFALHVPFIDLAQWPRAACPMSDELLLAAARSQIAAFIENGELVWVVTPRGGQARGLVTYLSTRQDMRRRLRVTTPAGLQQFIRTHCDDLIGYQSAEALRTRNPALSAAASTPRPGRFAAALLAAASGIAALPSATLVLAQTLFTIIFLALAGLRLAGAFVPLPRRTDRPRLADAELPRYTVVAALYDEVEALPGLLRSLRAFDYPPEKVEIIVVLEPDDAWTRLSAGYLAESIRFQTLVAPAAGPRTKPKALNSALPFARGELIVVYDAEDRPEPMQLRRAAEAFAQGGDTLGCVQARLTIDNTRDSWLTRLFTAEYAGLFDVLLPGLAALRLPLPLGGSSNHFRGDALRDAGAWDPYNVTEDADLGIRLARHGHATTVIDSTTYEEAPARLGPWLRQRTRWFKGWMQTLAVHIRRPRALMHDVGLAGAAAFYLVIGGTVLSALVQPFVLLALALAFALDIPILPRATAGAVTLVGWLHVAALIGGYTAAAVLGLIGLKRRGLLRIAWIFVALPVLWLLLSVAAWRAAFQLWRQPHLWEKTRHGIARTSRRGADTGAIDICADPPPPRRGRA